MNLLLEDRIQKAGIKIYTPSKNELLSFQKNVGEVYEKYRKGSSKAGKEFLAKILKHQ